MGEGLDAGLERGLEKVSGSSSVTRYEGSRHKEKLTQPTDNTISRTDNTTKLQRSASDWQNRGKDIKKMGEGLERRSIKATDRSSSGSTVGRSEGSRHKENLARDRSNELRRSASDSLKQRHPRKEI